VRELPGAALLSEPLPISVSDNTSGLSVVRAALVLPPVGGALPSLEVTAGTLSTLPVSVFRVVPLLVEAPPSLSGELCWSSASLPESRTERVKSQKLYN
jgi:hypothetical protein